MEFNSDSDYFNKRLSKTIRQKNGIFFTPASARNLIYNKLSEFYSNHSIPTTILEPSFGSGEFLTDVHQRFPSAEIYGVELNSEMYTRISEQPLFHNAKLTCGNFLEYHEPTKMDLIIGNPPYFVVKDKNPKCMTGRGNIFVQFIYKCLTEHLSNNGILAFVLPTSFYNCSYYEPCRKYIKEHTIILHVETIHVKYYETNQDTMILIIQNKKAESSHQHPYSYMFSYNNQVYISPYATELQELLENTATLKQLDFQVKTGAVVWNEHKEKLSNEKGTLVIYSNNIVNGELVLMPNNGKEKKQYIQGFNSSPQKGPAILVSRGYGNKYKFNYMYVDNTIEFYGENHVNVITPKNENAVAHIDRVLASFSNPKMEKFIKKFIGNGAISKTELETIVPIF